MTNVPGSMKSRIKITTGVFLLSLFFCASASLHAQNLKKEEKSGADTIVLHGRIYTLDAKQPWAQALADSRRQNRRRRGRRRH